MLLPYRTACSRNWRNAIDTVYQTEALEQPYDIAGEINLPPVQTMEGRAWERVMIIVPAFSQTQQRYDPLITAVIVRLELAFTKGVADRIHAPGGVIG